MKFGKIPGIPIMSYFKYSGNQSGKKVQGKIQASTVDEASQRLKRMGISVEKFGEDDEAIAPVINSAKTPASVTAEWQSFLPEHAKAGAVERAASIEAAIKAIPIPAGAPPVAPLTPPAPTLSEQSQARIKDTIEGLAKIPKEHRPPRRKHSYFFGDAELIQLMTDDVLTKQNGIVTHMSMSPDLHGKLKVAMVIEHDVLEARK